MSPLEEVPGTVFITGMQRSGTTLLEKLLASHPGVSVLSQPFPLLFLEAKRAFLRRLGEVDPAYPLGHLFLESRYRAEDLSGFLGSYWIGAPSLARCFEEMAGFSGQYTRFDPGEVEEVLARLAPGDFLATLAQLYRAFTRNPGARWVGGKESFCEELLPYFVRRGCRVFLILRDPRDILASLNHGRGQDHAGRLKPTLFNLRNWRKSVAFALHLAGRPGFSCLRYEELVERPRECLDEIARALDLEPFPPELFTDGIRDQSGGLWEGNSSHAVRRHVSAASVGLWREVLPAEVARYAEAACYPELRRLGYPLSIAWEEIPEILRSFEEPYRIERPGMERYSSDPVQVADELERLDRLQGPTGEESRPFFLFEEAHEALREAVLGR